MKKFRFIINGEGSGDIYALIAVVSEVQIACAQNGLQAKIMYLGPYGDYIKILRANDIKVHHIAFGGLFKRIWGWVQASWWVYWFMPNVILSNGGEAAGVVKAAGRFYFVPFMFHEQNAVPELRDQKIAKRAKKVTLAFEAAAKYFTGELIYTGTPVRSYILPKESEREKDQSFAKRILGFEAERPLIFINGGSAGAPSINAFVAENLPYLLQFTQIVHQTGRIHYDSVVGAVSQISHGIPPELLGGYKTVDYFEKDIQTAYVASDLVMGRSGPGNLAEIAAFGKPALLVPAPESENSTQRYNAVEFAKGGAAAIVEEQNLLPNLVISKLQELLGNPEKLQEMAAAAAAQYKPNAATDIAGLILTFAR